MSILLILSIVAAVAVAAYFVFKKKSVAPAPVVAAPTVNPVPPAVRPETKPAPGTQIP